MFSHFCYPSGSQPFFTSVWWAFYAYCHWANPGLNLSFPCSNDRGWSGETGHRIVLKLDISDGLYILYLFDIATFKPKTSAKLERFLNSKPGYQSWSHSLVIITSLLSHWQSKKITGLKCPFHCYLQIPAFFSSASVVKINVSRYSDLISC